MSIVLRSKMSFKKRSIRKKVNESSKYLNGKQ
jgi:hypothetical protein